MANYNSDYTGAQIDSAVSRANSSDVTAGTVAASKAVVVDSNKDITGFRHITATGTVTAANVSLTGNVDLGDASGDTVTITGSIDSNLIPATDDTYDLGSASNAWQDLFLEGDINFSDGAQIDVASGDFTLDVAGDIEFNADGGDFSFKDDSSTLATISSSGVVTGTMTITSASITDSSGSISFGNENLTTSGTIQYGSITDGSITITAFVDEDGMDSNSATLVPTQQSVKAYVDAQVTAQDLDFQGDSGGALNIDLDSETLTIAGGEGIDTSGSSNTITIAGEDATTSNKGIASFSSDNFSVSSGAVTIKDDGVILATETTGDYVQNITGGTGIDSTGATSGENIAHTLSIDLNELTTETSIADDDFIAMVDATDDASGKITFENLEDAIFASVSGDIAIAEDGAATIQANSVALGTDTTGNYVATIADSGGGGITVANSGAESAAVTLELDIKGLTDDAIASGDFIAFSDEGESGDPANRGQIDDVATLFAGTGLTASSAVIGVDASQTQITSVGTLGAGAISSGFGAIDNGSSTANFGATTVDSLSVSDGNVTNVGDIALDSISPDGTTINVAVTDNTSDTFTIKQGSDKYFAIDTTNSGEDIAIGTGISGTAISIGHSTSVTTVNDNLIVTGDLTVNGDTTTISTTNTVVADTLMELGNGTSGTPGNDSGIVIERGSAANAFIGFDESDDKFIVGTGTFTGASTGSLTITTGTLKANIEGNVTGNVTGNTSGTALTVTQAAQTAITSVGTLTALQVDNININGNTIISSDTNGHINLTPNGSGEVNISKVDIDSGTIDGATIATSDVTVGSGKTLDVSGGTLTLADDQIPMAKTAIVAGTGISLSTNTLNVDASQTQITSVGTLTGLTIENATNPLIVGDGTKKLFFDPDSSGVMVSTATSQGGDGHYYNDASGEVWTTIDGTAKVKVKASAFEVTPNATFAGDIDVDGTANLDVVDIDGAVDMASTLGVAGVVTANAGVVVDNITIDGSEIDNSSGNLTLDSAGDIYLDAGGADIVLLDDGTHLGTIKLSSSALNFDSQVSDQDITFSGNDGGSAITALTLDMSDGGNATFAGTITATGEHHYFQNTGGNANVYIKASNSGNSRLYFSDVADAGAGFIDYDHGTSMALGTEGTTAMTIDSSQRVGIGTTSPAHKLQVSSGGADGGIGLLATGGYNNVISFGDAGDDDIGKLIYDHGANAMTFTTNTSERMRILSDGRVAIKATSLPEDFGGERGHLCISSTDNAGANNYAVLQLQGHTINNDGSLGAIHFYDHSSSNCSIQANRQNNSGSGKLMFATSESGGSKITRITIYDSGVSALIANGGSAYAWNVQNDGNDTDRYGMHIICGKDDGGGTNTAIRFSDGDSTEVGKITFSGGTVTYGAFTAHHPCTIPDADNNSESGENAYPYGTLLETTSLSYTQKNGADTERGIRYNVRKSQSANSKKVLGAYGSCMNGTETHAEGDVIAQTENLHQALVLGDGHIICNNEGGNIKMGDGICTSSTEGIGMKATASPSMVIGIAQEDVSFSGSETKLVAVQYGLQQFTPWAD